MHPSNHIHVSTLIEAALQGDQRAYHELYRRYRWLAAKEIHAILQQPTLIPEVVQDTFVSALTKLSQLRVRSRFPAWLRRIAQSRAYDWLRTHLNDKMIYSADLPDLADPHPGPCLRLELEEEQVLLQEGLTMMPEEERLLLEAYHENRQPLKDLATRFHLPLGTVKRKLHEARRKLKCRIDSRVWLGRKAA